MSRTFTSLRKARIRDLRVDGGIARHQAAAMVRQFRMRGDPFAMDTADGTIGFAYPHLNLVLGIEKNGYTHS